MGTILLYIATLIGIFTYPVFTLGCVLINFGHPILGVVAIVYSIFRNNVCIKVKDIIHN